MYGAEQLEETGPATSDELDLSDDDLREWEDLTDESGEDAVSTVVRLVPAAESSSEMSEGEVDDNQSSGLRRLAGTLVRGLFGRRRQRREAA